MSETPFISGPEIESAANNPNTLTLDDDFAAPAEYLDPVASLIDAQVLAMPHRAGEDSAEQAAPLSTAETAKYIGGMGAILERMREAA